MPIDLFVYSLCRVDGQEKPHPPGLMVFAPPRKAARGRERDTLLISLRISGNAPVSQEDYEKLSSQAAAVFHSTHGALTTALLAAAESIHRSLADRNLSTTGRGQYVIGLLTLAVLREMQLTLLQCGPTHVLAFRRGQTRRLHDPVLAGNGLGLGQSVGRYFSQLTLQPGDRLLLCASLPTAWQDALGSDRGLTAIESTRKRLMTLAEGDVDGALILAAEGTGGIRFAADAPSPPPTPEAADASRAESTAPASPPPPPASPPAAHVVGRPPADQPSAYAIPPQIVQEGEAAAEGTVSTAPARQLPPSIPRAKPPEPQAETLSAKPSRPPEETSPRRAETQRQMARAALGGLQAWRRVSARIGETLRAFLPNLLPGGEADLALPLPAMALIALAVPLIVVTISVAVYMRFGASSQYDIHLAQALALRQQALKETDPVLQRDAWKNALAQAAQADSYRSTPQTQTLMQEAQAQLDALLGVTRLQFHPIFSSALNAEISRMAASDTDLYMLDAASGEILRAAVSSGGYEFDPVFDCKPGAYGSHSIGSLVDLLVLPRLNTLNSSVMGVDALGNLLYCAPGQTPRPFPLPLPATNWGRVTGMTLDNGRLYVLDAPAGAVWVYMDKDGVFLDAPLLFFGNQIPPIQDAIDIAASGDDLYLLHADGRLTHCTYSRIENAPTRCNSPVQLSNPFPAYRDMDIFAQAHFTQLTLTGLPDSALLLLDTESRSVFRLSARGFELQTVLSAAPETSPSALLGAMTFSPSHILYLASGGQVYAAPALR